MSRVDKQMSKYDHLSSPIKIGSVTIKNRMFMAPMDTGFGNTEWGGFTQEGINYFVRRAEGGFGLLFSGGINGDCVVDGCDGVLNHPEEFIRQGKEINELIAPYGCKMFIQLTMNIGRNAGFKTPSELPAWQNPSVTTKALTPSTRFTPRCARWERRPNLSRTRAMRASTSTLCTGVTLSTRLRSRS